MLSSNTSAVSGDTVYVEDVFSTWLFTGNSTTNNIVNGIDLSTKGGMLWTKSRSNALTGAIYDSAIGLNKYLIPSSTAAANANTGVTFNTNGFTVGANDNANGTTSAASWTFRKQPKFFDVVTYTGTGSATTIAHNLGSTPGCIIVKRTDTAALWAVYHRSTGNTTYLRLDATSGTTTSSTLWNNTDPTSTVFTVNTATSVNASGGTYVAYLFAHDAGGFGLTGTDNVISCGSFDAASVTTTTLGYEPQFLMFKRTDTTGNWRTVDNMRGWPNSGNPQELNPNLSAAETSNGGVNLIATGFTNVLGTGTYIYIAIRRGPMKVPTDATKVFAPIASSAAGGTALTTNFPVDLQMYGIRAGDAANITTNDRLRGVSTTSTAGGNFIVTSSTAAETGGSYTNNWGNTGFVMPVGIGSQSGIFWNFQRAPSFFDEVCYTGTGTNVQAQPHNLGVVPELMIIKKRSGVDNWFVGKDFTSTNYLRTFLNTTAAGVTTVYDDGVTARALGAQPTSTNFYLGRDAQTNGSAATYVAYLFATCAGVSKVGNYTGTGTTKQVDCGFAAGARFVLIKRTDSTGDWYVWDTARGIVSGNDPYLLLNSTAAETTTTDYIDPYSAGFELSSTAPAALNASGGTYIFLAIA